VWVMMRYDDEVWAISRIFCCFVGVVVVVVVVV